MIFTAVLFLVLVPIDAVAWGPATHLELGREMLKSTSLLPPPVAAALTKFPYDFLYGKISGDIVVAKNMVEELKHCHNWRFGFKLLNRSRSLSQRAFSYGYLSHLAADTIAHNHFIPEMIIRSFSSRILRHIYWELRFDSLADKRVWTIPKKITREVHRDNDRLLKATLEGTPFSFRTNKTIFSSILMLNRMKHWHRMLDLLSKKSKWALHEEDKTRYFSTCLDTITDILSHGRRARCTLKDPIGKKNLAAAARIKKKLKRLKRGGRHFESAMEEALQYVSI